MEPVDPLTDGRRRRSAQSRDRIIGAMLDLVAAGAISPSADEVAARAEVGLRSVFRHFKDKESLYREMMVRLARNYELWLVPYASGDWRGQLDETFERRLATYEQLIPFKRAADAHRHQSAQIAAEYERTRGLMRSRLEAILPPAMRADRVWLEALDMVLSFEAWQRLRLEQKVDAAMARDVVERQFRELIRTAPADAAPAEAAAAE